MITCQLVRQYTTSDGEQFLDRDLALRHKVVIAWRTFLETSRVFIGGEASVNDVAELLAGMLRQEIDLLMYPEVREDGVA